MVTKLRERGAAAVEFALILPVLLLIVGGVIDFGWAYYNQIVLSNAARDGVRLVSLNAGSSPTPTFTQATIQARIQDAANPIQVTSAATAWTCGATNSTRTVTVDRQVAFDWLVLGFVPGLPVPAVQGRATMTCP